MLCTPVVKTNRTLTIDVSSLGGHQSGEGMDCAQDEVRRGLWVIQDGVEPDAQEGDLRVESLVVVRLFELLHLLRSEVLGIEAVLSGVLVAGLAAGLSLGLFFHVLVLLTAEIVEGAFGGFLWYAERF